MQKYNAGPRIEDISDIAARLVAAAIFSIFLGSGLGLALGLAGCATETRQAATIEPVANIEQATAAAGELSLRKDAPLQYVVKNGDTLWAIASSFLSEPWQWPQLWYAGNQAGKRQLIYPGEQLSLILADGRTRLAGSVVPAVNESPTPQAGVLPPEQALPAIPSEAIRDFQRGPRLVTQDEIKYAPYVLEYTGEHVDGSVNHSVYVMNLPKKDPATVWAVLEVGEESLDPENSRPLGFEARPVGEMELRKAGVPAEFLITKASHEVMIGDRLMPIEKGNFAADFYPHAPSRPVEGGVISVFEGAEEKNPRYQIVALNRGSKAGLDPGTVLAIYGRGRVVEDVYSDRDIKLPDQYEGLLVVFKVAPKLSYALVMSARAPVHVEDRVRQPRPAPH